MKKYVISLLVIAAVAILGTYLAAPKPTAPMTGGDFPGGVIPNQLWTGTTVTNSVSPIPGLPNLVLPGYATIGGSSQYNQETAIVTGSSSPASVVTLGPLGTTSSSATSSISFNVGTVRVGDPCSGGASTSTVEVDGCSITAVGNANATGTLVYRNLTGANLAVPTSTVFRIIVVHLPY